MTAFGIKINITQSGFTTLYSLLWPFSPPSWFKKINTKTFLWALTVAVGPRHSPCHAKWQSHFQQPSAHSQLAVFSLSVFLLPPRPVVLGINYRTKDFHSNLCLGVCVYEVKPQFCLWEGNCFGETQPFFLSFFFLDLFGVIKLCSLFKYYLFKHKCILTF